MGKPPGAPGHTVPGKDVGYMPQVSIALQYLINEDLNFTTD